MNARALMLESLQFVLGERLGHRTVGSLAFGPDRDRFLLHAVASFGFPEEQAAARVVLNAIAGLHQPGLEDELAIRRGRRAARSQR